MVEIIVAGMISSTHHQLCTTKYHRLAKYIRSNQFRCGLNNTRLIKDLILAVFIKASPLVGLSGFLCVVFVWC
jgi:hypothetical protein